MTTQSTQTAQNPDTERWLESVRERYEVGPDGEMLLAQAAQTLDRIAECEAVIAEDGLMLPTRGGGSRVHPAARLLTDSRSLFLRYMRELGLEDE